MAGFAAGIDLDVRVAEAIGLEVQCGSWFCSSDWFSHKGFYIPVAQGIQELASSARPVGMPIPLYSKDLNSAFAAAEEVGLFDCEVNPAYRRSLFRTEEGAWRISTFSVQSTPSLAICAAILELRNQ